MEPLSPQEEADLREQLSDDGRSYWLGPVRASRLLATLDRDRAALAAPAGLDVERVKQAVVNVAKRHGLAKDPPMPLSVARIYGYSTAPAVMDAEIVAEYARLAAPSGKEGAKPKRIDWSNVVVDEGDEAP